MNDPRVQSETLEYYVAHRHPEDDSTKMARELLELRAQLAQAEPVNAERVAQMIAHRACCGIEHDPANGKLHGFCVVCGVPWPCDYAGPKPSAEHDRLAQCHVPVADALEALNFMQSISLQTRTGEHPRSILRRFIYEHAAPESEGKP